MNYIVASHLITHIFKCIDLHVAKVMSIVFHELIRSGSFKSDNGTQSGHLTIDFNITNTHKPGTHIINLINKLGKQAFSYSTT